jgi:tRNA-specific adenosine deaminase 3
LNDVIVDVDIVKSHLLHVSEESQKIEDALPITAAIVDPVDNKVISLSRDERHIHPLNHSVMRCVQNVALYEQERRKSCSKEEEHYLCENYHVYTTHEPCTMCSMALIHSRVSRLIYLKQMPETGALNPKSGEGYVIQEHKLLNSSYEVWEWLGDEYPVKSLDSSTNA